MSEQVFSNEDRIYKNIINSSAKPASKDLVLDLIKLDLLSADKSETMDLVALYDILGIEKFCEVIDYFDGRKFKFPKKKQVESTFITAIGWYWSRVKGKSIKETKDILEESFGKNIRQSQIRGRLLNLEADIEEMASHIAAKQSEQTMEEEENE